MAWISPVGRMYMYVVLSVCSRLELGFLPGVTLESGGAAVAMAAAAAVVEIEAEGHKGCSLA